jgi:hypothetical protein
MEERVIIDPQWFCGQIMGNLSAPEEWLRTEEQVTKGIVSRDALLIRLGLVRLFARNEQSAELALVALQQLCLCSPVDEPPNHFVVPILLREDEAGLGVWGPCGEEHLVCGRRFECARAMDVLSAGFFPKLQVVLPKVRGCQLSKMFKGAIRLVVLDCDFLIILGSDSKCK